MNAASSSSTGTTSSTRSLRPSPVQIVSVASFPWKRSNGGETCHARVEPADADVVFAVELVRADSMRGTEYVEGMGAYFHTRCYPEGSTRYKRKPKPE
jgi:hypothetical protein